MSSLVQPPETGVLVPVEDEFSISEETAADLRRATAPNTLAAYARWWKTAETWCSERGRTALPMTPQTLADFIGHLKRSAVPRTGQPYSPASLSQALAAVRAAHFANGYEHQPDTRAALALIKVHRRDRAQDGWRTRQARPVTLDALRLMLARCPGDLPGRRDASILMLGYGLFGRRSELASLRIEHVTLTDEWISVYLPMSKTDQKASGETIEIPRLLAIDIDALAVVRAYLDLLAQVGIAAGPLLRNVNRWGRPGESLSAGGVNRIVKRLAAEAGIVGAERMTAHGLRSGGPTDASERGVPTAFIAEHGRWSKKSTQVLNYVRQSDRRRNNPLLPRDGRS